MAMPPPPMPQPRIRDAVPEDLETLQAIGRDTISANYREVLGDEAVAGYLGSGQADQDVADGIDNARVLEFAGEIVGFSIAYDDLIHLMMVRPGSQRRGVGAMILDDAEQRLAEKGQDTLRLQTFSGHDQAINFYLGHGWEEQGSEADPDSGLEFVQLTKRFSASYEAVGATTPERAREPRPQYPVDSGGHRTPNPTLRLR